jgi:hypothetical protein
MFEVLEHPTTGERHVVITLTSVGWRDLRFRLLREEGEWADTDRASLNDLVERLVADKGGRFYADRLIQDDPPADTAMETVRDRVQHALASDELDLLLMGRWPYHIAEEYMAPSDVPTNWGTIVDALGPIAEADATIWDSPGFVDSLTMPQARRPAISIRTLRG